MIYLLVFFASSFLFYLAENIREGYVRSGLNAIAVLLPCVLAGCRDYSVGTDVMVYAKPMFDTALKITDPVLYTAAWILNSIACELLYYWMPWIIAQFSDNCHWLLFATQLLITVPTYFAIKKYQKFFAVDMWLAMLLWNILMYNNGLNAMRQMIAISFIFLACAYVMEKRWRFAIIYTVIAIGFHNTGLLGIGIFSLYYLLREDITSTSYQRTRQLLILVFFSAIFILLTIVGIQFLMNEGLIRPTYDAYFADGEYASNALSTTVISNFLLYLFLMLFHYHILIKCKVEWLFFTIVSFIIFVGQFSTLINQYLGRVFLYFFPFQVLGVSMIGRCYRGESRFIWHIALILMMLVYWYYRIVHMGATDSANYIFNPAA